MVVELDAFSGRPNPRWQLSESQAEELARLIADLKPFSGTPPPAPSGLGYRGFRVSDEAGKGYRVYGGVVQPPESVLSDPDRRVERFLLAHMPEALNDLRSWLESEI